MVTSPLVHDSSIYNANLQALSHLYGVGFISQSMIHQIYFFYLVNGSESDLIIFYIGVENLGGTW